MKLNGWKDITVKAPKNKGINTKANGIKGLNISSNVSELVIQYKLEIK